MNEETATTLVRRMFAAHRARADGDQERELMEVLRDWGCNSCAWEQAQWVREKGNRVPSRPQLREQLEARMDSAAHGFHTNDSVADRVGNDEAFWHGMGKVICAEIGCDPLEGQARAALMWASEVITPDEHVVRLDCNHPSWQARMPKTGVTQDFVEFCWAYAREVAKLPVAQWTDEMFAVWSRAWSKQMHPAGAAS